MMSKTTKMLHGQRLHNVQYPSATHYDTSNFETIDNPMIQSGGGANNPMTMSKFTKMKLT